jgi:hypothetical protein
MALDCSTASMHILSSHPLIRDGEKEKDVCAMAIL